MAFNRALRVLVAAAMLVCLPTCSKSDNSEGVEKWHRATLYFDTEGLLQTNYEGTGLLQMSSFNGMHAHFKAIHLEHWSQKDFMNAKYVDASFEGLFEPSEGDGKNVSVELSINNQVPLEIRLRGIIPQDYKNPGEEVVYRYPAGQHSLKLKGTVAHFYKRE
jgi:hypothetical protein